jgi:hypothetical protein
MPRPGRESPTREQARMTDRKPSAIRRRCTGLAPHSAHTLEQLGYTLVPGFHESFDEFSESMTAEVGYEVDPREIQTLDVSYINGMLAPQAA